MSKLRTFMDQNITFIKARLIINVYNTDCEHFWNHHGWNHGSYLSLAKQSILLYEQWKGGKIQKIF